MLRVRVVVPGALALVVASCNAIMGFDEASEISDGDASLGGTAGAGGSGGSGGSAGSATGGTAGSGGTAAGGSGGGAGSVSDAGDATSDVPIDTNCAANLQIDKLNCGYCGHDCLGGDCTAGKCQPVSLGNIPYGSNDLALGPDAVFVANGFADLMHKVPKTGGAVSNWGTGYGLTQIREYGGNLYFNEYNAWTIWRVPSTGALLPLVFHEGTNVLDSIAVDATGVYYAQCPGISVGTLYKVPLTGAPTGTALTGVVACPEQWALDSTTIYYTSIYDPPALYKAAKSGGTVATVTTTSDPTWALAQNGSDLYFTTGDGSGYGELITIKKDGTGKSTLTGGLNGGGSLFVDGGHIYIASRGTFSSNYSDGAIYRIPLGVASPAVDVIAENIAQPTGVAADATALYWVNRGVYPSGSGSIWKLAK